MIRHAKSAAVAGLFALVFLWALFPAVAHAQIPGDFLFETPKATVSFKLGYGIPAMGSDLFQDIDTLFTLGKSDFNALVIGGGVAVYLNDHMDLAFDLSYAGSSTWSEYVELVEYLPGGAELPIEQETRFARVPLTVSLRYFLMDRGREIGSFSWIPTEWSPYVGVGGGWTYYDFEQSGDFVDYQDYSIFTSTFRSNGWALTGHVLGGAQYSISPRWVVTAEARYSRADQELDRPQYQGYEPIDLSGFQGTLGFGVRF
jgi:opacity protein-like surface antigen